jgi:hypothetical protein
MHGRSRINTGVRKDFKMVNESERSTYAIDLKTNAREENRKFQASFEI